MVRGPMQLMQTPLMDRTRIPLTRDLIGHFKHVAPDSEGWKENFQGGAASL